NVSFRATMHRMTYSQIQSARQVLERFLRPSRLIEAESISRLSGGPVFLKMESELPTASFKVRGAIYSLALNLERHEIRTVIAASTGNHGAAVAYAARMLGVRARIFLPASPNPVKRRRIAELGADIVEFGRDLSEAFEQAMQFSHQDGVFML